MVSLKIYHRNGTADTITARQYGRAFDIADERGAVCVVDGLGEAFIKLQGEWVGVSPPGGQGPAIPLAT